MAAMDAFWKTGYEATSVADLCLATGLKKGSLYQAFGDKRQLFVRALKHYMERSFRDCLAESYHSDSALENLRAFMSEAMRQCSGEHGCMAVNTLSEMAPHDLGIRELLQDGQALRLRALGEMIDRAKRSGEINSVLPTERMALQLMVVMAGTAVAMKGAIDVAQSQQVLDDVLSGWK